LIDIHCHILPGLDDGPRFIETSIDMAALAARDGIRAIIATPHTDGIRVNKDAVKKAVGILNTALADKKIEIAVYNGYEIPSNLVSKLAANHTLAGSNYTLLEFPHTHLPADAQLTVSWAVAQGIVPIIAHPERNPDILANPDLLADLLSAGALAQLTAASITGEMGYDIQRCSLYLLKKKQVHFIATDSHSPTFRQPVLSEAYKIVKKLLGWEEADRLTNHNPGKVIHHLASSTLPHE
jgi:protein-tyrosine phosphatase